MGLTVIRVRWLQLLSPTSAPWLDPSTTWQVPNITSLGATQRQRPDLIRWTWLGNSSRRSKRKWSDRSKRAPLNRHRLPRLPPPHQPKLRPRLNLLGVKELDCWLTDFAALFVTAHSPARG